jgi:nucleoside-diphosphate-sugar epimerase
MWPEIVRFVAADVATDPLEPLFEGADAVVHLAWLFQPTHRPLATWRANALGSARVFDAVAAAWADALVYASSVGTYTRLVPAARSTSRGRRTACRRRPTVAIWRMSSGCSTPSRPAIPVCG